MQSFKTLPDYLAPNLDIVFVGINPGEYSARVGHYFARKQNGFWTALKQSGLLSEELTPQDDHRLPQLGFGLTDIAKRPSARANLLADREFVAGGEELKRKLEKFSPLIICFVGLYGYRQAFDRTAVLGLQPARWKQSYLFIVPSTSPLNARYRKNINDWFKQLKILRDQLKGERHV
ncbi:MAG: mismatch-specific DNA-glycosylase [Chloroflexi bacterium]|nr:mismatch-specific DNA-glycosylase [Chloroflexota bacterium]